MDNIELQIKKLQGHWTAHQFTVRSRADVESFRSRFDKCDKKTKMKILLSLINMDPDLRRSLAPPLKRLLQVGSSDKDEWVQVIAGLVDKKLFSSPDDDIQQKSLDTLHSSAERVVKQLLDQVIFDDKDVYQYFEPLLTSIFTSPVKEEFNPHCTYTDSGPDFILREQKIRDAKLDQDKQKAGYVTLMHNGVTQSSPQSNPRDQRVRERVGPMSSLTRGSGGGLALRKGGTKSVSLQVIQEKVKEKERMKDKERSGLLKGKEASLKKSIENKKRKSDDDVSTSVSKVAKVSHEDTTSVALTEADNGEVGDKVVENDGERALPQAPVPGASLVLAPPSSLSTTKSDMAVEGDAPVTSAAAITTTSAVDQAKKICDEIRLSSLVSDEDKVAVDKFFRDKELNQGIETEAVSSSPEMVRKIKIKEDELTDENGDKKIVRIILELRQSGSNYSYKKLQKTVKKKLKK